MRIEPQAESDQPYTLTLDHLDLQRHERYIIKAVIMATTGPTQLNQLIWVVVVVVIVVIDTPFASLLLLLLDCAGEVYDAGSPPKTQ